MRVTAITDKHTVKTVNSLYESEHEHMHHFAQRKHYYMGKMILN